MEEALDGIAALSPEERERILGASRLVVQRILHAPTVGLRELAGGPAGAEHLEVARRLFELNGKQRPATTDEGKGTVMGRGEDDGE
jgi:glutamyl-tRNA reductase